MVEEVDRAEEVDDKVAAEVDRVEVVAKGKEVVKDKEVVNDREVVNDKVEANDRAETVVNDRVETVVNDKAEANDKVVDNEKAIHEVEMVNVDQVAAKFAVHKEVSAAPLVTGREAVHGSRITMEVAVTVVMKALVEIEALKV